MSADTLSDKILVTGASGLIGKALCEELVLKGHQLIVVGRSSEGHFKSRFSVPCEYCQWSDPVNTDPPEAVLQARAVIHLMGEPLFGGRWSEARKNKFYQSRIQTTKNLLQFFEKHNVPLDVFISASAIGYYGDRGDEVLSEDSSPGTGFLAQLCQDWEAASQKSICRSVQVRTGIVLSANGGALAKMLPAFRFYLGGMLGDGRQWMSWVHIEDVVNIYVHALENTQIQGPINAVSMGAVTNRKFTRALAGVLGVKAICTVPRFALQFILGEVSELVLSSQLVIPEKLSNYGFKFKFVELNQALQNIFHS